MNTKLDNRTKLIQLIKKLNDTDAQQLLTFAVGIEVGKKLKSLSDAESVIKGGEPA